MLTMAATKKKDFKQGVDYFLSNGAESSVQETAKTTDTDISTGQREENATDRDSQIHTYTDKYAHNDTHTAIILRPLPARPKGERKSRRLNLLVRPSMYDSLSIIASQNESSVNDLINNILEDFVARSVKKEG